MPFDIVDAYVSIEELNTKVNWLYEKLVEQEIIEAPEEDKKTAKKK